MMLKNYDFPNECRTHGLTLLSSGIICWWYRRWIPPASLGFVTAFQAVVDLQECLHLVPENISRHQHGKAQLHR